MEFTMKPWFHGKRWVTMCGNGRISSILTFQLVTYSNFFSCTLRCTKWVLVFKADVIRLLYGFSCDYTLLAEHNV